MTYNFCELFLVEWCSTDTDCQKMKCGANEKCEYNNQISCMMDIDCKLRGCHETEKQCKNNGKPLTANIIVFRGLPFSYMYSHD